MQERELIENGFVVTALRRLNCYKLYSIISYLKSNSSNNNKLYNITRKYKILKSQLEARNGHHIPASVWSKVFNFHGMLRHLFK